MGTVEFHVPVKGVDATANDELATLGQVAGGGAVSSVFGRTGAVVAATNDYTEAQLSFSDITTNNASTSQHGFVPKLPNDATKYYDGTGAFSVPAGSSRGSVLDYVTRATDLTVTATTSGTAQTWISGNSVSYNGATLVLIECWCALCNAPGDVVVELYEDSTLLGRLAQCSAGGATIHGMVFRTPSNASHAYTLKAFRATSNGTLFAASATFLPAFLRITVA